MKIKQVNLILNDSSMQEKECNFKLLKTKAQAPAWFKEFEENQGMFNNSILKRFDNLDARIDNLVKKNHLTE